MTISPMRLLYVIAACVEMYSWLTHKKVAGDLGKLTPPMLDCASMTYAFKGTKARELLGFESVYSFDESVHRTVTQWLELHGK